MLQIGSGGIFDLAVRKIQKEEADKKARVEMLEEERREDARLK